MRRRLGQVTKLQTTVKHRPTFVDADFGKIAKYVGELNSRTFELEPGVCALVTANWDKPLSAQQFYSRVPRDRAQLGYVVLEEGLVTKIQLGAGHAEGSDAAVSPLSRAQSAAELDSTHSGVVPMVRVLVCARRSRGWSPGHAPRRSRSRQLQIRRRPCRERLYLVRHGAYVADRNADPQLGPGLTPLGIAQARLVAARLNGSGVTFDSMTSSTLQRARDTAAVMHETLANVPLAQSALLSECTPPVFEPAAGEAARERA